MQNRILPFQGSRLVFFSMVMLCSFIVLIARLYEFQFTRLEAFEAAARENAVQSVPLPSTRGIIYDRYGVPLALNAPAFNVAVTPAYVPDDEEALLRMLNRLSALVDVPATPAAAEASGRRFVRSLQDQIDDGARVAPYREVVVAADVPQAIAQIILEDLQNLPGVSVDVVSVRQYPSGSLTAQIIGYLGPIGEAEARELLEQGYNPAFERVGYAGVEAYFERDLAGERGLETRIVDVAGLPIQVLSRREPIAGKNIRLTIDLALQRVAEQALRDRINIVNARAQAQVTISGSVIAIDLRTGEVLAMVSLPTYDNTRFARAIDGEYYLRIAREPQTPLVNHAIQSLYPPGSVWKLVSAAGVLEEKVVPWDYYLYDAGELFVENSFATNDIGQRQRFVCWLPPDEGGHKWVNMVEGIAWSCDVYFYQVGGGNPDPNVSMVLKPGGLGIENLNRYATALSIGVRTGIELPAENGGRMPDRTWKRRNYGESWSTGDTYNAAFGQGYVTVTPLQLLTASMALANGGYLYQPTILHSFLDSEGNVIMPFTPKIGRTILPPSEGQIAVLNMREDMLVQGKNSLACICEPRSPYKDPNNADFYDPNLPDCTDDFKQNYKRTVSLEGRGEITYTVHIPYGYRFGGVCNPLFINDSLYRNYQPPFVSAFNLRVVEEGMRQAVINPFGTAKKFDLGYQKTAGKTGTAEYCDDIAAARQLCRPGEWPTHAWFFGYAPYDKPEIGVITFVYNAGDGSKDALPVAKAVVDCYFKMKSQREQGIPNDQVSCVPIQE